MKRQNILLSVIVFATLTRVAIPPLFGHLANFSALDALALFCGAYCSRPLIAIMITLVSVWIGDLFLTHTLFYEGFYWQYASYALIALLGSIASPQLNGGARKTLFGAQRRKSFLASWLPLSLPFVSAILFFAISNFGVWFSSAMYPHTIDGLVACSIAAIPFFKHTLASDLVFTAALFGAMGILGQHPAHKERVRATKFKEL